MRDTLRAGNGRVLVLDSRRHADRVSLPGANADADADTLYSVHSDAHAHTHTYACSQSLPLLHPYTDADPRTRDYPLRRVYSNTNPAREFLPRAPYSSPDDVVRLPDLRQPDRPVRKLPARPVERPHHTLHTPERARMSRTVHHRLPRAEPRLGHGLRGQR